jgi:hypothetical protein
MTFLKKEMLRTTKPTPIVVVVVFLIVAAVVSVGYITALAILAPEQLAEAAVTATDVICTGCVGTTDIADGGITSTDLADNAVTSAKIGSGQVANSDIRTNAVTTTKISDTNGVQSVDIVDGQVGSADIADGGITSTDIASGAIKPNVHMVRSSTPTTIAAGSSGTATVDCPSGEILTGGGFSSSSRIVRVFQNFPSDQNTWSVAEANDGGASSDLTAYAICIGPSP